MSDWPASLVPSPGVIHNCGNHSSFVADAMAYNANALTGAAAWPAANRALYMPFGIEDTVTAYQMAFEVGTQSGNCDVGIYDELGNRLVSKGSTAVGAAGIQVIDITDTVLTPGVYFMALCVDNTTATITRSSGQSALWLQVLGMQQQAVGAVTLPDPATFANPASAYLPGLSVALKATI